MFYVNENIPCRKLSPAQNDSNFAIIFLEITLRNRKWLLIGLYKPPGQKEKGFLENLNSILNKFISKYENITLIGAFNSSVENKHLADFTTLFNLESLIKPPTCLQFSKPTCIDLILTNNKELFKNSKTFEVGISDHYLLTLTSLRIQFIKGNPKKKKFYRDYKSFNFKSFNNDLDGLLKAENNMNYPTSQNIFLQVLNTHPPVRRKVQRFNNNHFMTKQLRKAVMRPSRLKNIYNKTRIPENWDNYRKQPNFCVDLLRRTKRSYFRQINIKDNSDNKTFWYTIKPFFSNKGLISYKLILLENDKVISEEPLLARTINEYFTNITKNLNLKPSPRF